MATAGATTEPSTSPNEIATATEETIKPNTPPNEVATATAKTAKLSLLSNGGVTENTESGTPPKETTESSPAPTAVTAPAETPRTTTEAKPPPYPLFIAVLGQTGTGKTTFINDATGKCLTVGHTLESCTEKIAIVETTINGRPVRLIDTPGFDDSNRDDADILETIGVYLREAFTRKIYLTGVIYLHRITDVRMQGSALRSLLLLKKLCGPENYGNIALATTRWDEIFDPNEGSRREEQLKSKGEYWADLIEAGAIVHRHDQKKDSAIRIIEKLLPKPTVVLQFQQELEACKSIGKTSAGAEVIRTLGEWSRVYEAKIQSLQKELKDLKDAKAGRDAWEADMKKLHESQIQKLKESQDKVAADIQLLNSKLDTIMSRQHWTRCSPQ